MQLTCQEEGETAKPNKWKKFKLSARQNKGKKQ